MATTPPDNSIPPNTPANTEIGVSPKPVVVNLRAAIEASGNVVIFGPSEEQVQNVIWCKVPLPASALYDGSDNAMFEFWEPSNDLCGNIVGRIASSVGAGAGSAFIDRNAASMAEDFRDGMQAVLNGNIDASDANPFLSYVGAANEAYTFYPSFGHLALAYAAEGMFGHPSATAAITNDVDIVDGFNKADTTPFTQSPTVSTANQALAQRLAHSLLNLDTDQATNVVRVVLGQDASRATNEDNSARQTDVHSALRFYANDVIYVQITLDNFQPQVGGATPLGGLAQQFTPNSPGPQTYILRIELS